MRPMILGTAGPATRRTMFAGCSLLVWAGVSAWAQYPPPNLQAEIKSPTEVLLTWGPVTGTTGYHVFRAVGAGANVRLTSSKLQETRYPDATLSPSTTYRYRVAAVASDGLTYGSVVTVTTPAQTPVATAQRPGPAGAIAVPSSPRLVPSQPTIITSAGNPTNFTAELQGNRVLLSWRLVPGVSFYLLGGPGFGANGKQVWVYDTSLTSFSWYVEGSLAAGQHEWTVASLSGDKKALTHWTSWPKAQLTILPASGRYRISLAGFKVNHETYDDYMERDGKRDEVFTMVVLERFNRKTGALVSTQRMQSKVFGDANGFPDRVPQGSASNVGGLRTGDVVPVGWDQSSMLAAAGAGRFPMVLWDGNLTNDEDALVLRPTIWEWDGDQASFLQYSTFVSNAKPADTWQSLQQTLMSPDIGMVRGGLLLCVSNRIETVNPGLIAYFPGQVIAGRDRPIGIDPNDKSGRHSWCDEDWFLDKLVVLTREKIESQLTSGGAAGAARGLLPLRFVDVGTGNAAFSGDYTVYLRIERLS